MNEDEMRQMSEELYQVEAQKRYLEAKEDALKTKILGYMHQHGMDHYYAGLYRLERKFYTKYGVPTPERLREILGKDAEHYIKIIVVPEVRQSLPPQIAVTECPVLTETEYVRLVNTIQ